MFLIPPRLRKFHNLGDYRHAPKNQNIPEIQTSPSATRVDVGVDEGPEVYHRRSLRDRNPIAERG